MSRYRDINWDDVMNSKKRDYAEDEETPSERKARIERLREAQKEWDRTWGNPHWLEPSRFCEKPPRPE